MPKNKMLFIRWSQFIRWGNPTQSKLPGGSKMKKQNQHAKTIKAAPLLLLAAGLLLALAGCGASEANSNAVEAVAVRTARVETANIAQPIRATGILSGKAESKLSFKIGGIVDRINVSEGQSVRQGQLLATLKLAEINAQVHQAQNAFDKAGRDLQRVQNLYRDSVATLERFQDVTTAYEVTKSSLEIAKFNQQYASIYAPAAGKILKRFARRTGGRHAIPVGNDCEGRNFALKEIPHFVGAD
jgi:multidrug efflux pump subunit AcrA (membrane-fusion protein)